MEQALIAQRRLDELPAGDHERTFYAGKIASARYYLNQVLPQAFSQTEIVKDEDRTVLDVPEEAFSRSVTGEFIMHQMLDKL